MDTKYALVGLLTVLGVPAAAACMQTLDSSITSESPPATSSGSANGDAAAASSSGSGSSGSGSGGGSSGGGSSGGGSSGGSSSSGSSSSSGDDGGGGLPVCQNGAIIDPSTNPVFCTDETTPTPTQTPGIELADGGTTVNACDLVEAESLAIRQTYCATCHSHPGVASAPFHDMLEDNYPNGSQTTLPDGGPTLLGTLSIKVQTDAGYAALIVPGDPANSVLLQRLMAGTMPPPVGIMTLPKPTVSDIALLQSWIANMPNCFNLGSGGSSSSSSGSSSSGSSSSSGGMRDAGRG